MAWEPPPNASTREDLSDWWLGTCRKFSNHHLFFTQLAWGDRLSRLFAVACCRAAFSKKLNKYSQGLLDVGEKFADGLVIGAEPITAADSLSDETGPDAHHVAAVVVTMKPEFAAGVMATLKRHGERFGKILWAMVGPGGVWSDEWRTEPVIGLARGIYDDQAWDRMPILADALPDAGCNHPQVLGYCRGEGPFCRGCWVIDRILQLR